MLGIVALCALFIITFLIAIAVEETFGRALLYATLLTLSITGFFTASSFILPPALSIVGIGIFLVMVIRGDNFLDALFQAAVISRLVLLCIALCTIALPAAITWALIHLVDNWPLYLIIILPIMIVAMWYTYMEYGPAIKVHIKHALAH